MKKNHILLFLGIVAFAFGFQNLCAEWVDADGMGQESINTSNNSAISRFSSLCLDASGNPHIAWSDYSPGNYDIYYLKWNGSAWVDADGSGQESINISNNSGTSQAVSLCLYNGNPRIAWGDVTSGNYEIYYLQWNGSVWVDADGSGQESINVSNNSGGSNLCSLRLDSSGNPHIAWQDSTLEEKLDIYYLRWNGSAWVDADGSGRESVRIFSSPANSFVPSLYLDSNNNAHVTWMDFSAGGGDIYYLRWNGAAWRDADGSGTDNVNISNNSGESDYPSIYVNLPDIHIAWEDETPGNYEIYYLKWDGSAWVDADGYGQESINVSNNSGVSVSASLCLDNSNKPHIAWQETSGDREIYYLKSAGASWVDADGTGQESINVLNNAGESWAPSLQLYDGNPRIAWHDDTPGNYEVYYLGWTVDTSSPAISNVSAGSLSSSGATITWSTDESATSQVEYGLTTSYGTTYPSSDSTADTTSHSVTLSSLSANTLYHYRVISTDSSNNTATSTDATFTTSTAGSDTCYEPNDNFSDAYTIDKDTTIYAYIWDSTDKDYYKFYITHTGTITINLTSLPADYELDLYNSSYELIGYSRGTSDESITKYLSAVSAYYIHIYGFSGASSSNDTYCLSLSFAEDTIPMQNLAGYWQFNDGSGSTAADSSGNGNTGTIYGGADWVDGKYDGTLNFDGSDDYVDCGALSSMDITGPFTLGAWIKTDSTYDTRNIITKGDSAYGIQLENNNAVMFYCGGGSLTTPENSVANNVWTHIAAVYTGSEMKIYINGTEKQNAPFYSNPQLTSETLKIGRHASGSFQYFSGCIDEVFIYSRALSADEIASLYPGDTAGGAADKITIGSNLIRKGSSDETIIRTNVSQSGYLTVTIYDLAGKKVKEWSQYVDGSNTNFTWDGKMADGRYPPLGIYCIKVEGLGINSVVPVVIK